MAKVTAPLGSFSASGKIGKALVFFSHLGRNVVRGLVTPKNPQSETQGDTRLLLGALGRSARGVAQPSDYLAEVVQAVPAGQTWNSSLTRRIIATYGSGAAGVAAFIAAYEAQGATNWEAQAALRGLTDMTISYAASTQQTITAGAQLYALAVNAIAIHAAYPTLFNATPYTVAIASWTSANVVAHKNYLAAVA
jgi:hypothetical protein